jgi:hypothetical protein
VKHLLLTALLLLPGIPAAQAQSCSLNTYGSSYYGSCRGAGGSFRVNGHGDGPTRINGHTTGGGSVYGTVSPSGTFRGTVNGRYVTCDRRGCW